jgi:hypothetical protein
MILDDPLEMSTSTTAGARSTLDDLFRRAAQRNPDMLALVDPPNRASFTDGTPRSLTYAQADSVISAIAERLHQFGLPVDTIVGVQLPNTVESILTLLGIVRAGLIATPLPLLWRSHDLVTALNRVGAKALITCRQVGATDHVALAMEAAVDIFPIRYVCAFGADVPDGVVALDDLYTVEKPEPPQLDRARAANRAAHLALITWETTTEGLAPVARNHAEIIAGGLAVLLEGRFENGATFLSGVAPSSFAGVIVTMLPWLITGGTLALHQPFDPEILAQQLRDGYDAVILPAPVVPALAEAGLLGANVRTVIGLWRAPERMNNASVWFGQPAAFIDVACFGETCLIPARRGTDGKAARLPLGIATAPRGGPGGAVVVADLVRSDGGNVTLSGPMIPRHAYPPGAESTDLPHFKTADGVVDTGYSCRIDEQNGALILTAPPRGIAGIGGYRFALRELQKLVTDIDSAGRIAALPDRLSGHRLAGAAEDKIALRDALITQGVNPLVAAAFA